VARRCSGMGTVLLGAVLAGCACDTTLTAAPPERPGGSDVVSAACRCVSVEIADHGHPIRAKVAIFRSLRALKGMLGALEDHNTSQAILLSRPSSIF
jgi:hypothetical protein